MGEAMFDTYITVVGTVLTSPEWRRVQKTGAVVTSFRVASRARRFDRGSDQWVDGPSLRIRVNCWRRLAEGTATSVLVGDPVVIYGRISTRDWKTEQGESRVTYELDAVTVGHDLSRGRAKFQRVKPPVTSSVIEDEESESRINGEASDPIVGLNPARSRRGESFDEFAFVDGASFPDMPDPDLEAMAILREAGLVPGTDTGGDEQGTDDEDDTDGEEMVSAAAGSGGPQGRSRRRERQPVPA
jgi:single-strand DNA-binding protein